jgi:hypothetical protein
MNNQLGNRINPSLAASVPIWYVVVAIALMLVVQNMLFAQPFEQLHSEFRPFCAGRWRKCN